MLCRNAPPPRSHFLSLATNHPSGSFRRNRRDTSPGVEPPGPPVVSPADPPAPPATPVARNGSFRPPPGSRLLPPAADCSDCGDSPPNCRSDTAWKPPSPREGAAASSTGRHPASSGPSRESVPATSSNHPAGWPRLPSVSPDSERGGRWRARPHPWCSGVHPPPQNLSRRGGCQSCRRAPVASASGTSSAACP